MALTTRTAFIYGHTITDENEFINFSENGIDELAATVENGSFTLSEFVDLVASALNDVGDNTYTATIDRTTRKITISADANFDLLVTTGTQTAISAFSLIGFTTDRTGASSYEADIASGDIFEPQAPLYDYAAFENNEYSVQSKVNESSSGQIELVTYGTKQLMECNIKYITNITGQNLVTDNPTGVADANKFMQYIRLKRPIEFLPDKNTTGSFTPCFLESTSKAPSGDSYMLRELYSEKLANYFETGKLVFRKIN